MSVYVFLNNAFLLWCVNIQLHTFNSACLAKTCMIFKCMIMYSTVHLLKQYGFMADAENHRCERRDGIHS